MSERTVCSNTHFERCAWINCPCYREGRESVTADQNQKEQDKLGANNNPLANERITRRGGDLRYWKLRAEAAEAEIARMDAEGTSGPWAASSRVGRIGAEDD